jgi:hypothetical protein
MAKSAMTEHDWAAVRAAARAISALSAADTPRLRAARFADLQAVLAKLRRRYGDLPALFETEADFTLAPAAAVALYRRAEQVALIHGLPTVSIRVSLARLLLNELGHPAAARAALLACSDELPGAAEADCDAWSQLLTRCERPPS